MLSHLYKLPTHISTHFGVVRVVDLWLVHMLIKGSYIKWIKEKSAHMK